MTDAGLRHHGDAHRSDDRIDHVGVGHTRHATLSADIGWYPLECHDRNGAGVLGDLRLLDVHHVHDDAALEHLGHATLHALSSDDRRHIRHRNSSELSCQRRHARFWTR